MAEIAAELRQALARRAKNDEPGRIYERMLASGRGWQVFDLLCTSGPQDRTFEECHGDVSIAVVASGTFQYRGSHGSSNFELMSPGSILLGNAGGPFECGHQHGAGDRCVAFKYTPGYLEELASDAGVRPAEFGNSRLPAIRDMAPLIARACLGVMGVSVAWQELGIELAVRALALANGSSFPAIRAQPKTIARVSQVIRTIECALQEPLSLGALAAEAGLSPYHFLRAFQIAAGVTPHQYILRSRLRSSAVRLLDGKGTILDAALDCGFGDLSNFTRTFRAEFGVSPREYRRIASRAA